MFLDTSGHMSLVDKCHLCNHFKVWNVEIILKDDMQKPNLGRYMCLGMNPYRLGHSKGTFI